VNVSRIQHSWNLLKYFGPKWLIYRAWYAARFKSGLVQFQMPATSWGVQPLSAFLKDRSLGEPEKYAAFRKTESPRFFFDPRRAQELQGLFRRWDSRGQSPLATANDVGRGIIPFFSHERTQIGLPPRWHTDPFTGHEFPTDRHWSEIGDFQAGDIKLVWETNRFQFVFPLVRAYWRTGNEDYATLFWRLLESWYESNPPQTGANWKCGQEISLRVMAWCFGLFGFSSSRDSTPDRIALLAQAIAVSGCRIEANIGYALSQQNNHGLSEAMGLWTIGSLFPEFVDSARWAALGKELLERQARELIYADGSFSQHSMNYHRLMLHDYLWSIRLGDVLNTPFSDELRERIARAGDFVFQLQDESTGRVPCYGQDDGALILPLNNCDYRDYRPVVQAAHFLVAGKRKFDQGPWDEDLFWLFGVTGQESDSMSAESIRDCSIRLESTPSRRDFYAPEGGYQTLRAEHGFALVRAAAFRHRPAQADMLHVDVWWRGLNIAIDPGTYSYNAPAPWNNPFAQTQYHNTLTVDGLDQMQRVSRFIWLPWLKGRSYAVPVNTHGDVSCWNGEHDGYQRLADPITHRRGLVRLGSEHWLIVDAIHGVQRHPYRVHWLLMDAPFSVDDEKRSVELQTTEGNYRLALGSTEPNSRLDVMRADPKSPRGWRSSYYHSREPAISIGLEVAAPSVVFATVLGPDAESPIVCQNRIQVQSNDWNAVVSLNSIDHEGVPLISSVVAGGSLADLWPPFHRQLSSPQPEPASCTYC
jgi:hypothetical protein